MMPVALAALFFVAILTLWVPAYWPVTVFQVGIYALASAAAWRARRVYPLRFPYPLFPLLFAVLWGILQLGVGHTAYVFDTQTAVLRWASFLAAFITAFYVFQDRDVRGWFRSAMLWFGFAIAVLATLQTFTSGGKVFWIFPTGYFDSVMGPILSSNHYAAFIEILLPIALYEALRRDKGGLLYAGMAATMYASVIASASRAGTVLATAEILAVIAIMRVRGRATGRAVGMTIIQMAALFAVFTTVVGWERVASRFWMEDPVQVRREFAISSVQMVASHPWFGVGLGTWPTVYPRYAIVDVGAFANQAHNDWLQWTAEGGLPLGIVMITLFVWCLRPAFRSVWGLGVIAVFLHAIVDYPFSKPALGAWPILIIGMMAAREAHSSDPVRKKALPKSS